MTHTLEQHIGEIVQAEIERVRAEGGASMAYKVRRVSGEAGCFRVAVSSARPIARLAPVLSLLAEVEERLEERYEGLRLMLIPEVRNSSAAGSGTPRSRRAVAKRKG